MKKCIWVCAIFLAAASAVSAQGPKNIREHLTGYQEDPLVISTAGHGDFHARISNDGTRLAWELSYRDLEGGAIQQAHIHLGQAHQNGGVIVFLCTNQGNGPAGTLACPPAPATISGVIEADDILGPAGQGIAAMEFGNGNGKGKGHGNDDDDD